MEATMAYLGPPGTFCEAAARQIIGRRSAQLLPCASIEAVFAAVETGRVQSGTVPIENSCQGSVTQTLDLLAYEYDLNICAEVILPIRHNLLVQPGTTLPEISCILSHSQALAQCRRYLSAHYPGVDTQHVESTAEAARRVADSAFPWAAIGSAGTADAYGLEILSLDIQDRDNNQTRFVTLSRFDNPSTKKYNSLNATKTSLLVYLGNKPGALYKALEKFYFYNVNMTKIESRPAKTEMGDYIFFIDIEGHHLEPPILKALEGLTESAVDVRVLGSYRTATFASP